MTASVDAQMRCVACVDALRDRGWAQYPHIIGVYPGGDEVPGGNGIADRDLDVIAAWFLVAHIHDGLCRCSNAMRGLRGCIA